MMIVIRISMTTLSGRPKKTVAKILLPWRKWYFDYTFNQDMQVLLSWYINYGDHHNILKKGDRSFSQITSPDQGSGMQGIWVHAPSINIDIDISNHANSANSIQMQFSELKCVRSYNDVVVSFKTGNETHLDTNGVHGVQCGGFVHLICQQGFLSYYI